jgi:hypothetical protein
MQTVEPSLWEQLTPEQRDRVLAVLVQMLLRHVTALEVAHDPE